MSVYITPQLLYVSVYVCMCTCIFMDICIRISFIRTFLPSCLPTLHVRTSCLQTAAKPPGVAQSSRLQRGISQGHDHSESELLGSLYGPYEFL